MRKYLASIVPALLGTVIATAAFLSTSDVPAVQVPVPTETPLMLPLAANIAGIRWPTNPFGLTPPVVQFRERITFKRFGTWITPETSPVANDKFTGFHTGVDVEFPDTGTDIPVVAVTDGTVITSTRMNGYGGVVVVRHTIAGNALFALYGHLDPVSMTAAGTRVTAGDRLGVLGDDHSEETDGARKHLHFSLYAGERMDYRGYVPEEADLTPWVDPLRFF